MIDKERRSEGEGRTNAELANVQERAKEVIRDPGFPEALPPDSAPIRRLPYGAVNYITAELSTLRTALAHAEEQIREMHCKLNDQWARVLDERDEARQQIAEKDKEIERLNGIIAEIEALLKEWEGTGYNPNQMARLVNELTKSKQSVVVQFEIQGS